MAYLLAVNRTHRGKLPPGGNWHAYNRGFEPCDLTAAEIADEIRAGHAIAAVHAGNRTAGNWRMAQHIGIDLDDGALSWDEVVFHPVVDAHAAIVHTTASHTPQHPRMRVLFLLDTPYTDAAEYTAAVAVMLRVFATADAHCKDASRLFFGAPDCSLLLTAGNELTRADIDRLAADYPAPTSTAPAPRAAGASTAIPPAAPAGSVVPPAAMPRRRLDAHTDALLEKVRSAPDGAKWATLAAVARLMGGYAAAGYYTRTDAERQLQAAIETRRATVTSMPAAYDTIDRYLTYGEQFRLYFHDDGRHQTPPAPAGRVDVGTALAAMRAQVTNLRLARRAELARLFSTSTPDTPEWAAWVAEYDALMAVTT